MRCRIIESTGVTPLPPLDEQQSRRDRVREDEAPHRLTQRDDTTDVGFIPDPVRDRSFRGDSNRDSQRAGVRWSGGKREAACDPDPRVRDGKLNVLSGAKPTPQLIGAQENRDGVARLVAQCDDASADILHRPSGVDDLQVVVDVPRARHARHQARTQERSEWPARPFELRRQSSVHGSDVHFVPRADRTVESRRALSDYRLGTQDVAFFARRADGVRISRCI